jgi:hypothetical protein
MQWAAMRKRKENNANLRARLHIQNEGTGKRTGPTMESSANHTPHCGPTLVHHQPSIAALVYWVGGAGGAGEEEGEEARDAPPLVCCPPLTDSRIMAWGGAGKDSGRCTPDSASRDSMVREGCSAASTLFGEDSPLAMDAPELD